MLLFRSLLASSKGHPLNNCQPRNYASCVKIPLVGLILPLNATISSADILLQQCRLSHKWNRIRINRIKGLCFSSEQTEETVFKCVHWAMYGQSPTGQNYSNAGATFCSFYSTLRYPNYILQGTFSSPFSTNKNLEPVQCQSQSLFILVQAATLL